MLCFAKRGRGGLCLLMFWSKRRHLEVMKSNNPFIFCLLVTVPILI